MINIILCGGVGSRLWPLSRTHLPKQFARILPGESLFEGTVKRNQSVADGVLVASNRDQSFLAASQLRGLGIGTWQSVIEPVGRNTAPAIALACMDLDATDLVLVTPSDHFITKTDAYVRAVKRAIELANLGKLVTFGIKPEYPETGFGYIEAASAGSEEVLSFKEKPDGVTAQGYVDSGNYYWNSGMFCFTAGAFLSELKIHAPGVYSACQVAYSTAPVRSPLSPSIEAMSAIPSISIDYAVMEKSSKVAVVPCDIGWSDLGSFDALYEHLAKDSDASGNAFSSDCAPVLHESTGNLIINGKRTVALVNVDDLLVIESPDALLIAKRGESQNVKQVVDELKRRKSERIEIFPRVERPWGNYTTLYEEAGYKVKRIEVAPGQRLSLQRHEHREEHWTIVHGEAVVQVERSRKHLSVGQGIMIPQHAIHRLENPGATALVINEVQIGSYLGEDDIERLEDDYLR